MTDKQRQHLDRAWLKILKRMYIHNRDMRARGLGWVVDIKPKGRLPE